MMPPAELALYEVAVEFGVLTHEQAFSADKVDYRSDAEERARCAADPAYFIAHYCQIYDTASGGDWIPFVLWPAQVEALKMVHEGRLIIILKARQLGLSWLMLGYALWVMVFKPIATIQIFSRRDDEATYLLGEERLRGMYKRLPAWLKTGAEVLTDNDHEFALSNGSIARALPTTAGDSYTATFALADEFDLVPDQKHLLNAVRPTVEMGGKMVLLSRANKALPNSLFKRMYRAAKQGLNAWQAIFIPWHAHPARDPAWYDKQCADAMHNAGTLDDVHEQYPATDAEALSARTLDKRIAPAWLLQVYAERSPLTLPEDAPAIPTLEIYQVPQAGKTYRIGADPAEGNPTSDDSALTVLDKETGEEVAALAGKFEPSVFASHIDHVGTYYNRADALVERNNHGHAVLLWLRDNSSLTRVAGHDGKEGWLSNSKGKALLYDGMADACRDKVTVVHSFASYVQLASIEGSSLRAPDGDRDDRADSYALAWQACIAGSGWWCA